MIPARSQELHDDSNMVENARKCFFEARLVGNCFSRPVGDPMFIFFVVLSSCLSHQARFFDDVNVSAKFFQVLHAHTSSPSPFVRAQAFGLCESTQCGLEDLSCDATSVQACARG